MCSVGMAVYTVGNMGDRLEWGVGSSLVVGSGE
jgi:hypothetical protein